MITHLVQEPYDTGSGVSPDRITTRRGTKGRGLRHSLSPYCIIYISYERLEGEARGGEARRRMEKPLVIIPSGATTNDVID